MSKLLKLFGKVERTDDINLEGIGMGLTICEKIVKCCGGEISCYSDGEEKGSTFAFSMKILLAPS